jgi:hypothetical protein
VETSLRLQGGGALVEAVYLAAQEGASKFHRAPSLVRLPRDIEIL